MRCIPSLFQFKTKQFVEYIMIFLCYISHFNHNKFVDNVLSNLICFLLPLTWRILTNMADLVRELMPHLKLLDGFLSKLQQNSSFINAVFERNYLVSFPFNQTLIM